MRKFASVHADVLDTISEPWEKMAYMGGAEDAAATMDSAAQGGGQPGAPGGEPEIPGGGEGPQSLEEVAQLLAQMVEAGELDEATATQVMQELAAGGGEGAPEGAAPEGAAPGGDLAPMAEDGAPETEEAKAASVLWQTLIPGFAKAA